MRLLMTTTLKKYCGTMLPAPRQAGYDGLAQVNGLRGATPTVEIISRRIKMDLWYINNWTLWLDVQILAKTFFEVLRKRNAY